MIPTDWAFECWGYLAFVMAGGRGIDWWKEPAQVSRQDTVLKTVVQPVLTPGQWFFRRQGLRDEVPAHDLADSVGIYVRLVRGLPRADACRDLQPLNQALVRGGHPTVALGSWDRCFGRGYGEPLGQAALREFCCQTTAAFLTGSDPFAVAQAWLDDGTACAHGIAHWLSWIIGESDEMSVRGSLGLR